MKKTTIFLTVIAVLFVFSCSDESGPSEQDVTNTIATIQASSLAASSSGLTTAISGTITPTDNGDGTVTITCTDSTGSITIEMTYNDSDMFADPVIFVMTFTDYTDAASGMTFNGKMTNTIIYSSYVPVSGTMDGELNIIGGEISHITYDLDMDFSDQTNPVITGTVVADGTTFTY